MNIKTDVISSMKQLKFVPFIAFVLSFIKQKKSILIKYSSPTVTNILRKNSVSRLLMFFPLYFPLTAFFCL